MADVTNQIQTVGRRKRSVARVLLRPGTGKWVVNGREMPDYFPRPTHQIRIEEPFKVADLEGNFDVFLQLPNCSSRHWMILRT